MPTIDTGILPVIPNKAKNPRSNNCLFIFFSSAGFGFSPLITYSAISLTKTKVCLPSLLTTCNNFLF